jgi:hypothetical protein
LCRKSSVRWNAVKRPHVSASFFLNVLLARAEIAISSPCEMSVLEKHQYLILRPERRRSALSL